MSMTPKTPRLKQDKPDPYCSFTDDRNRLWALMSRDVRFVLCTLGVALAASQAAPAMLPWLWRLVKFW